MKARYIGGESAPGTQETVVFGMKVKCGQIIDVPPQFERKALINAAFEVLDDAEPAPEAAAEAPKAPRKRKTAEAET
jgi:hypothetical protein